jgi:hypothetical protein
MEVILLVSSYDWGGLWELITYASQISTDVQNKTNGLMQWKGKENL